MEHLVGRLLKNSCHFNNFVSKRERNAKIFLIWYRIYKQWTINLKFTGDDKPKKQHPVQGLHS